MVNGLRVKGDRVKGDRCCCLPDGNYHLSFIHYHLNHHLIDIAKIQPPPTAMSRFVSYCPELSLNVAFCLFLIKNIYKITCEIR